MISGIGRNEVHVWRTRASQVCNSAVVQRCLDALDGQERERMSRFATANLRHLYLVRHSLVRFMLSSFASVAPAMWHFGRNQWGAPYVCAPDHLTALRFSLSHSGDYAACAVALGREVGLDIEQVPAHSEIDQIIEEVATEFSEGELAGLRAEAITNQPRYFARLWTAREAYVKARGSSLSITPASFAMQVENVITAPRVEHHTLQQVKSSKWGAWLSEVGEDYQQAIVVRRQAGEALVAKERQYAFEHE
jgi:4'-phosphopantetheinyl transferase